MPRVMPLKDCKRIVWDVGVDGHGISVGVATNLVLLSCNAVDLCNHVAKPVTELTGKINAVLVDAVFVDRALRLVARGDSKLVRPKLERALVPLLPAVLVRLWRIDAAHPAQDALVLDAVGPPIGTVHDVVVLSWANHLSGIASHAVAGHHLRLRARLASLHVELSARGVRAAIRARVEHRPWARSASINSVRRGSGSERCRCAC